MHVILRARRFQEAMEPKVKSTQLSISLWSLRLHEPVKSQICGHSQGNILAGNENFIRNSCAAFQIFLDIKQCFSISHADVTCKICNQAATSSPKFCIQCEPQFMNHWGNGFTPPHQGFHSMVVMQNYIQKILTFLQESLHW